MENKMKMFSARPQLVTQQKARNSHCCMTWWWKQRWVQRLDRLQLVTVSRLRKQINGIYLYFLESFKAHVKPGELGCVRNKMCYCHCWLGYLEFVISQKDICLIWKLQKWKLVNHSLKITSVNRLKTLMDVNLTIICRKYTMMYFTFYSFIFWHCSRVVDQRCDSITTHKKSALWDFKKGKLDRWGQ